MTETALKLRLVREILQKNDLAAVRLKGVDWFSWATAGGNSVVILTNETGVGEVLITNDQAWVLTNAIEQERFRQEEVPGEYEIWAGPWSDDPQKEAFVLELTHGGKIATDRPEFSPSDHSSGNPPGKIELNEVALPEELIAAKRRLLPQEIERYRQLGTDAAIAMTETMRRARPEWTEFQLAAEGAKALWERGIHPTLTLVGGEDRVARHRHPFPTSANLGKRAMLVFCARRHGLYANLTRWVYFRNPTEDEQHIFHHNAMIEAVALGTSKPGNRLSEVYREIVTAYDSTGNTGEHLRHHQGGTTGYLSREVVATSNTHTLIEPNTALAWNPSLTGSKLEDTILSTTHGIEVLTVDPAWPTVTIEGRKRPALWVNP